MTTFIHEPDPAGEPTLWVLENGDTDDYRYTGLLSRCNLAPDVRRFWPDVVARMTGTTITNVDTTVAAIGRVAEFLRQWQLARNKGDLIYGVHHDIDADMADLTVSDLTAVLAALTGGAT